MSNAVVLLICMVVPRVYWVPPGSLQVYWREQTDRLRTPGGKLAAYLPLGYSLGGPAFWHQLGGQDCSESP